jgi:glycosyltransferase involved in cell wall biosynthesis
LRIVYLASSPVPSSVASGVQVVKMCQGLARAGHDVILLVPARPEVRRDVSDIHEFYGVDRCFEIRRVAWPSIPGRLYYLCALAMAWAAKRLRPELVYGRFLEATVASAELRLPVVFEYHLPPHSGGIAGRAHARLRRHPRLKRIVVISEALKREYLRRFPHSEPLLEVVPDAADDPGQQAVDPLGPRDRLQVGYVGNVYPGKGVETVLEMAKACPGADFHVIGGEPAELRPWRELARHQANLKFHGYVPHGLTDRYRLACDVLLAPYDRRVTTHGGGEAAAWMSPLKLFEYMAAGRAILVSDLPALRDLVRDGVDAIVCEPGDARAWVAALDRLARDPDLRARLGQAARAEFLRKHTWIVRARAALRGLAPAGP